jgi:class 3 adenylate cyclase
VVTTLFSDVVGSTALAERLDPEAFRDVMNQFFAAVREIIEHHGGTVAKFIGDAVMAVFGVPYLHEDDALRAVRAAADIRAALPAIGEEIGEALELRMGVNTGRVLVGQDENIAIGDAVNVAARLEQAARPGEIIIGEQTLDLVRDAVEAEPLEPLTLKGKSHPVRAFRVLRVKPQAPGVARRLDAPLVGRERELAMLRAAWERTVDVGECHLFTILGAAGVGKSRLVAELVSELEGRAMVLSGRCLPYGDAITFWPLTEALAPMRDRTAGVLELLERGGVGTPGELFWKVRTLLESLAAERPVLLHVDDVQWGEPMLLDLLDSVLELSRGAPLMVLCAARPEFLETRAAWGGGRLNATACLLEPLHESEAAALLQQHRGLNEPTRERILEVAQGNPLFLQEMAALVVGGARLGVPLTIQALLAARLEHLEQGERQLLECAAIEGEVFHRASLEALLPAQDAAALPTHVQELVRKEFIRPAVVGKDGSEFRFSHLLLRDAAYEATPIAARAEMHQRRGTWMAEHAEDHTGREEIAGWHLERAGLYLRELGRAPDPSLSLQAAERLFAAGRRASERWDIVAARSLLERALALSTLAPSTNGRIAIELADQLIRSGDFERAGELLSTAESVPELAGRARLSRLELEQQTLPHHESVRLVSEALPELLEDYTTRGDHLALAKTRMLTFWVRWYVLRAAAAAEEARLAAEHARLAGSEHLRQWALTWYLVALADGPSPIDVLAEAVDLAEREQGAGLAPLGLVRGEIARREGRFEDARAELERAATKFDELGHRIVVASCRLLLSRVLALRGDLRAALAAARQSDALLEQLGERGLRSTVQAEIASLAEEQGDPAAARAAIALAEELSDPADLINTIILSSVRARLALDDGDVAEADRWSRRALERAGGTDYPLAHAYSGITRIRVQRALGHHEDAIREGRRLIEMQTRIGDQPQAELTRSLIADLEH